MGYFLEVLNFNWFFLQLNRFICNQQSVLPVCCLDVIYILSYLDLVIFYIYIGHGLNFSNTTSIQTLGNYPTLVKEQCKYIDVIDLQIFLVTHDKFWVTQLILSRTLMLVVEDAKPVTHDTWVSLIFQYKHMSPWAVFERQGKKYEKLLSW